MTGRTFCLLLPLLYMLLHLSMDSVHSHNTTRTHSSSPFAGVPGVPGSPGRNGAAGRDGRDGVKGEKGERGLPGGRGVSGTQGISGDKGASGEKGERGAAGPVGIKGNSGKVGPRGPAGSKGEDGGKGQKGGNGSKGSKGEAIQLNWKQCIWTNNDGGNTGKIQECQFKKTHSTSALHVVYSGVTRVYCSSGSCCSRWYLTFNGSECSGPAPIDLIVYKSASNGNPHRTRQMEGYCENIPSGNVVVALHVGKCARWSSTVYDAHTGWHDYTSRILITEVPPSQQQ